MSGLIAISTVASRPKVHRLPTRARHSRRHQMMAAVLNYGTAAKFVFTLSSIGLAVILIALFTSRFSWFQNMPVTIEAAITLPHSMLPVPVSDAAASTPSSRNKTIVLKGQEGTIVGQMAKMSPQGNAKVEVGAISTVDNHGRQELLSIVNQY